MRASFRTANRSRRWTTLASSLALVMAVAVCPRADAANADDNPTYDRGGHKGKDQAAPKDTPGMPPFPRSENLARLDSEKINSDYEYWIDIENVTLDLDGVVRYTLVMRTPKGVPNIFFEGFRCDAQSYRTYAYGTRQGDFAPFRGSAWRRIDQERESQPRAYLWLLYNRYFCSFDGQRYSLRDIRALLSGGTTATNQGWRKAWDK